MYASPLQRWVLTPPKGLGTISSLHLRLQYLCASLAERVDLSRISLVTTSKVPLHP
jgi:hypothetical protein